MCVNLSFNPSFESLNYEKTFRVVFCVDSIIQPLPEQMASTLEMLTVFDEMVNTERRLNFASGRCCEISAVFLHDAL